MEVEGHPTWRIEDEGRLLVATVQGRQPGTIRLTARQVEMMLTNLAVARGRMQPALMARTARELLIGLQRAMLDG